MGHRVAVEDEPAPGVLDAQRRTFAAHAASALVVLPQQVERAEVLPGAASGSRSRASRRRARASAVSSASADRCISSPCGPRFRRRRRRRLGKVVHRRRLRADCSRPRATSDAVRSLGVLVPAPEARVAAARYSTSEASGCPAPLDDRLDPGVTCVGARSRCTGTSGRTRGDPPRRCGSVRGR